MSTTDALGAQIEQDSAAASAAAAAIVRSLPATDLAPGEAVVGAQAIGSAVPAPGSKAVTANISGSVSGTLVITLHPELAAAVENGPLGPQEMVAGLEPALTDATGALSATYGDVRFEAPQALDAEIAVANAAQAESVCVVPFMSNGAVAGAVVLLVNHSGAQAEAPSESASFEPLSGSVTTGSVRAVELLNDVEMGVTAELGRTRMTVRELLAMQPGSIVELDRAAGSPVDLLVNGTLVARGEVVVIDEEFGVRITEIIGYDQKRQGQ